MFVKYLILFNAVYPVYSRKRTFRYIRHFLADRYISAKIEIILGKHYSHRLNKPHYIVGIFQLFITYFHQPVFVYRTAYIPHRIYELRKQKMYPYQDLYGLFCRNRLTFRTADAITVISLLILTRAEELI